MPAAFDEHVDPVRQRPFDRRGVAHVRGGGFDPSALGGGRRRSVGVEVERDDPCAGVGEPDCDLAPEPAAAAGDYGDTAGKRAHFLDGQVA